MKSTLFPYTTLFRSLPAAARVHRGRTARRTTAALESIQRIGRAVARQSADGRVLSAGVAVHRAALRDGLHALPAAAHGAARMGCISPVRARQSPLPATRGEGQGEGRILRNC